MLLVFLKSRHVQSMSEDKKDEEYNKKKHCKAWRWSLLFLIFSFLMPWFEPLSILFQIGCFLHWMQSANLIVWIALYANRYPFINPI